MTAGGGESPSGATPFGRYLLAELIARGGMGEVFRAVAVGAGGFEKPVVVKRILPSLGGVSSLSEMFIEEARLMSRLVHPNIVQVIDFGQGESDDYFLVMELVEGVDLREFGKAFHERGEPIPVGLAAFIITQVLRGLSHAHTKAYADGRTLVHRDVSPGNVLLSCVGEVKVADFGVAHVAQPDAAGPKTLAGKPGYIAPEQIYGDTVDGRADVFSTGVVLHLLLTGEPAFQGDDDVQRQASASLGRIRDPLAVRPDIGADLAAVIAQALAPDPDARFATARAMSKAIEVACASAGTPIASADELADHVERLTHQRANKKVVALSDGVKRELTRTGAFTMRVTTSELTDVTDYSTVRQRAPFADVPPEPAAPPTSNRSWIVLALVGVAVGVLLWWQLGDDDAVIDAQPRLRATDAPTVAAVTSTPPASTPLTPSTTASAPAPPPRPPLPRSTTSAPPPPPPPPPPVATSCQGKVLLSSKGSWWVSGGPTGRVQSPGVYTWRCGSYGLTATSRVDGKVVSRSVTVSEGAAASARFE